MNHYQIAAKQRRIKEWLQRAKQAPDQSLHVQILDRLNRFRELLAELAGKDSIDNDKLNILLDLERQLEKLDNSARLRRGSGGRSGLPVATC